ncbi:tetratricopeptide repeat protein 19, mitochondrial isoform X3 [Arapaima gigas]
MPRYSASCVATVSFKTRGHSDWPSSCHVIILRHVTRTATLPYSMAARCPLRLLQTCVVRSPLVRWDRTRVQWPRALLVGRLYRTQQEKDTPVRLEAAWCAGRERSCSDKWNPPPGGRSRNSCKVDGPHTCLLWSALALSIFNKTSDEEDEAKKKEDEIIMLLKRAKLSIMREEFDAADRFLHHAVRLAHQSHNTQAIIYTYTLMGNLALIQGQLPNAEKLFKAAMSFMLSGGTPEDDNAVIEMSLKLASIYGSQDRHDLAEHGFRFCVESLEAKIEKQKELFDDSLTDEERKNTRLLLGLCLDSRARYLTAMHRLEQACSDYQRALQICQEEQGEDHPQSLVLMNDLATVLDAQGYHEEALRQISKAVALGKETDYTEQHVLLGNMAGILLHQGQLVESACLYQEALAMAQAAGDGRAVEHIKEGLKELGSKEGNQAEQFKLDINPNCDEMGGSSPQGRRKRRKGLYLMERGRREEHEDQETKALRRPYEEGATRRNFQWLLALHYDVPCSPSAVSTQRLCCAKAPR